MKRMGLLAVLALAMLLALSACQKKQETETSSAPDSYGTEEPATDQTAQAPDAGQMTEPEPAPPPAPAQKPKAATTPKSTAPKTTPAVPAEAPNMAAVPVGTQFDISMVTPLDTRTSNVGDPIEGRLVSPIVQDGVTVAPEGAMLRGEVTQVQRASKSKSEEERASLAFVFTSIETVEGEKPLHATVTNAEGKLVAGGTGKRDALIIGGSTIGGAVLGKVLGKDTKGAVLGAVGGAVVGTGIVLSAKGHELEVPAGSRVQMRVDEPITVVAK
jgi:type IV secretory pathway VirB10-like protein